MKELARKKWDECLGMIREMLGNDAQFDTWFSSSRAVSLQGNHLTLELPSQFCKELYETQFFPVFSEALCKVIGPATTVTYVYPVVATNKKARIRVTQRVTPDNDKPAPTAATTGFESHLNSMLSFDNYCVSSCNKLPWTIAESIARNPVNSNFNPFFLYGSVGVGKTHLMQAIGIRVASTFPGKKVLFIPMKEFQRLYANAAIKKQIPAFLNWFMQIDVLLFDDLQELANKEKTLNDALFPIFNHLHQHGRQLVFTCDRPPQELEGIHERLIDRFKWGIIEKLERPDGALKRKILSFKAKRNGLDIPREVLDFIADAPINSVREIEGIVLGMMTRSIALGRDIDMDMAREVLKNSIKPQQKSTLNFEIIVENVAEHFNLNPDVIFSKSRVKDVAEARMTIMYLANKHLGLSTSTIGMKLGRKHSTVIHGIRAVAERIERDPELADFLTGICQ